MKVFTRRRTSAAADGNAQSEAATTVTASPAAGRATKQPMPSPSHVHVPVLRNSPRLAAKASASDDTKTNPDQEQQGSKGRKRKSPGKSPGMSQQLETSADGHTPASTSGDELAGGSDASPPNKKAGSLAAQRPAGRRTPSKQASANLLNFIWLPSSLQQAVLLDACCDPCPKHGAAGRPALARTGRSPHLTIRVYSFPHSGPCMVDAGGAAGISHSPAGRTP